MKNMSGVFLTSIALFMSMIFLVCLFSPAVSAEEQQVISARYSRPRGTKIKWRISIPEPPPAAVIIIQSIPPETVVESSEPAYHSYDRATGTVKWLLTDVKPGKISMKMKLDTPIIKKGEIRGEIIFQDTSTNPVASVFITSPKGKVQKQIEGC